MRVHRVPGRQGGRCRVGGTFHSTPDISGERGRGCPPAAEAQAKELREVSGRGWGRSGRRGQQERGSEVGKESREPEATPCSRLQRARPAVAEETPAPDSCPPGTHSPGSLPPQGLRGSPGPRLSTCASRNWGAPPVPGEDQLPSARQPSLSARTSALSRGVLGLEDLCPWPEGPF